MNHYSLQLSAVIAALLLVLPGCSIKKLAVNRLGDALAAGGTTFAGDDDPDLVRDAAPFSLKTMEALLAESPKHVELRRAAAAGFVQYAYAFVQQEADEKEQTEYSVSEALRQRARKLYLRARDHGLRGLDARYPGFEQRLRTNAPLAAAQLRRQDVPLAFWTGAAWAAAVAQAKDHPELIGELPLVEALMDRALVLDEGWNAGAIHGFLVTYEMIRPGNPADAAARAQKHFDRAVELSKEELAGPFVALAESVTITAKDRTRFDALLQRALKVNPDARPEWRLENLVMQRRARWLLSRMDELFVSNEKKSP